MRNVFAFFALGFVLNGCSLAPKVVHLENMPATSQAQFSKPVCVIVGEFKDERKNPQLLGHTYNMGVKTSDVKTYGNVPEWVKATYARELKAAGAKDCKTSEPAVVLSGVIKDIDQAEFWNVNTSMKVDLKLSGPHLNFAESFEGKSSQISHAASDAEFTESLYKAIQDLMKNSVSVIVTKSETAEKL